MDEEAVSATKAESKEIIETKGNQTESLLLPEGIPSDFPLPDPMNITEVNDGSDEDMFIITLKPEGTTFGDITFKQKKQNLHHK